MIKKITKQIFTGRKSLQSFFFKMYEFSLMGMQYGQGKHIDTSGELRLLNFIKTKLEKQKSLTIFDVGANKGEYSKACLKIFGDKLNLYAFEPSKASYIKLKSNIPINNRTKLFNLGFGENSGEGELYYANEGSKTASVYNRSTFKTEVSKIHKEKIDLMTLDDFCSEHNVGDIDLLKLDTEGNELEILIGAENLLIEKRIKYIQFEFGPCNIDSKTFFEDFFSKLNKDYDLYRVINSGLVPIKNYSVKSEIFLNINYVAIQKSQNN